MKRAFRILPSHLAPPIPVSRCSTHCPEQRWIPNSGYVNSHPSTRWSSTAPSRRPRTALFFPGISVPPRAPPISKSASNDPSGQGVQRVGMTAAWLSAFPRTCKPFLEELDHILSAPLSSIIAQGPNSTLTATINAQPAIMSVSIMVLRVLEQEFDFQTAQQIDVTLGHSLGEFAALVSSQHMGYVDALRMMRRRAEVMARCSKEASQDEGGEYGMVALVCEPDGLSSLIATIHDFLDLSSAGSKDDSASQAPPIPQVSLANINSKNQVVLSGNIEKINTLLVQLRQFGGHDPRAVRLSCDSPFHSPMMVPAKKAMQDMLETTDIAYPASFPCISNISARPFESVADLKDLLARQCVETVRWWDCIRFVDQEMGVRRWIGLGPGKVGRNLVGKEVGMRGRDVVRGGGVWGVTEPREVEDMLRGLEETEDAGLGS